MKRTSLITLAILGALTLTSCKNEPQATSYENISECVQDGHERFVCEKAFEEAKKVTEQNAPKYATAEQCAAQFNNCQKSSDGSWFMPAVMGYMVGNMMSNGSRAPAQPVYIDRYGYRQTASFTGGNYRPTPAPTSYSARAAAARASTSSRGGFGSRASAASS